MTNEEIFAVVKAKSEGKEIQIKAGNKWITACDDISQWNFGCYTYRVKPTEPRRVYINIYSYANNLTNYCAHESKTEAECRYDGHDPDKNRAVEFVEVIKENN